MRQFDAAFVITVADLEEVLREVNVLGEVQRELRKATEGVISRSWNDELSGPEE